MEVEMKKNSNVRMKGKGASLKSLAVKWNLSRIALAFVLLLTVLVWTGCSSSDASDTGIDDVAVTADMDSATATDDSDVSSDTSEDVSSDMNEDAPPDIGEGAPPDMGEGGPPSAGNSDVNKTGAYEQDGGTASESGQTYAATETDESAVYVYGAGNYTLSDATLTKTGETSSAETSNFYGNNAIVLAEDESTITLTDCSLTADSEGSNGAFAYGEGSSIIIDNCTISTTADSSRGVDATYGGSVTVSNSEIHTLGAHSAALATDRYEDNDPPSITADNVTATTAGDGSPGIYSTGTFNVSNSNTVATGAEAAAIEGFNSITLTDSDITGSAKWGVFIYQSMSGDSSVGVGTFDMTGGSLTNNSSGPVFMVLNTEAIINLQDVDISTEGDVLIRATNASDDDDNVNSSWGSAGGDITFNATDQALSGTVSCNELSSMDITLSGSSTLSGAVEIEDGGEVTITLEDSAVWTAADDSYVTSLDGIMFSGDTPTNVDADFGVVIYFDSATDADGNALTDTYTLSSGGTLVKN
jgi:hypothetical protein